MASTQTVDTASFMEEIQQYECLYNKFSKHFKNRDMKENCWGKIAEKFAISKLEAQNKLKNTRLKSTPLICGCHLSKVGAKFVLGLFLGPIPILLFLAVTAIIWKPSSFNDRSNLNTTIAAIVAIIWKPGFIENVT